jgi:hypothetical protein
VEITCEIVRETEKAVAYMPNDAGYINRNEWRAAVKRETAARVTGNWGPWERIDTPHGGESTGWVRDIRYVFRNSLYVVLCRPVRTEIGEVVHCAIRTASNIEPPWRDKQRIKNECFGWRRIAVEVMPSQDRVVDGADMYHMWIYPEGYEMPFCLTKSAS